jgi:glycerol-3-phosphate O-acyltransferase
MDRARSWLLRRVLALWVRYKVRPDEAVSHVRDRDKPVCYVLENSSVTDLAVLQDACVKLKLPRPQKRLLHGLRDLRSFFYLS